MTPKVGADDAAVAGVALTEQPREAMGPLDPVVTPVGDDLRLAWPAHQVTLDVSHLHDGREGITGELLVTSALHGEIHWGRLNLVSGPARATLVKTLERAAPVAPWALVLERACRLTALHVRAGAPVICLMPRRAPATQHLIAKLLLAGQSNVLFGDGDSGKSLTALALAVAVSAPCDLPAGLVPTGAEPVRVLYLDYEGCQEDHEDRLADLLAGLGRTEAPPILYRSMVRPLADEAAVIRSLISEYHIGVIIIDSLAPACGPEPEGADAAVRTFTAMRSFGAVTRLVVAHLSHATAAQRSGPAKPFGSTSTHPVRCAKDSRSHRRRPRLPRSPASAGNGVLPGSAQGYRCWQMHRREVLRETTVQAMAEVGVAPMIAAIYARKSTDDRDKNEEARSTTRQMERATAFAQAQGWTVDPRYIFVDEAVSGAEWTHRPAFNALVAALEPAPPFGALVVMEQSRLGRDTGRVLLAIQALEEAGVAIWSYASGGRITVEDEAGEMSATVLGLVDRMHRRQASRRTYDALRRRAEAGAVTGGRVYGYRTVRDGAGYARYVVQPDEAAVVRAIFTRYAEGAGLTKLAKQLNAEHVPAPRGGTGTWAGTAIRDMLRRSLYAGVLTWNRTQKGMRRGTKSRRARAAAEWLERPVPELAIIDADLWQRVQTRRAAAAATFLRRMDGRLIGRPSGADVDSPYLLSGLAECAECGGSLVAMTRAHGRHRAAFYGCLRYHKRGVQACRNGLQIRQAVLDGAVLDVLAAALAPDVIAAAIDGAVATLRAGQDARTQRRSAVTAELAAITGRERRLLDALADGDGAAGAIRERLRAELARRDALTAELGELDAAAVVDTEALLRTVTARAADLRALLGRHVTQARQVVRQLLEGRLVCAPFAEATTRGYTFTARGTYRKLGVPVIENPAVNVGGGPNGIRTRVCCPPRAFLVRSTSSVMLTQHRSLRDSN